MKQFALSALLIFLLVACQKSAPITETKKENYFVRVAAPNGAMVDYSSVAIAKAATTSENAYGSLQYIGYEAGYYALELTNKQSCGVDFYTQWLGNDTTIFVIGGTTKTIQLPGAPKANEKFTSMPLNRCGSSGGDLGQLEIITPIALPVTFKYIRVENSGLKQLTVYFEVSEASGVDVYYIQVSKDGLQYTNALEVRSDKVIVDKPYSVVIQLQ